MINVEKPWTIVPELSVGNNLGQPYPIEILPEVIKDAILCIHEYIKVPIPIAANSVLFAINFIVQRKYDTTNFSYQRMPCSLYFLSQAESGDRKTTADNIALKVLHESEKKNILQYKEKLKLWKQQRTNEKNANPEPLNPKRIFSESTLEPLIGGFIRDEYKDIALSSSDGADFLCGHNFKAENSKASMASLTKLFDGISVERNRSKSNEEGSGVTYDARLCVHLMGQANVIKDVLANPAMTGIGLLPRFIFCAPQSLVGRRLLTEEDMDINIMDDIRLKQYYAQCQKLLGDWIQPLGKVSNQDYERKLIGINKEARELWRNIFNFFEIESGKGLYKNHRAFASRAGELVIRLSATLAAFEECNEINIQHMCCAEKIVKYSLEEWINYNQNEVSDAEMILAWLVKRKTEFPKMEILKSSINQHLKKFSPALRDETLKYLVEADLVREMTIDGKSVIEVNPHYLKKPL